jgi:transcription elongation GreA/GreB family factor
MEQAEQKRDEADAQAGRIAFTAPLAVRLSGKRVGDTALVQRPKGATEVTVMKVWYEGISS